MSKKSKQVPPAASLERSVMPNEIERETLDEAVHCPNCDHQPSKPINDIWKDPNVKAALKEGRPAEDIAVLSCPKCGRFGYYNQGSSFWCRFCEQSFYCCAEDEEPPDRPHVYLDGFTSLADTVTVTTDGYDNVTLGHNAEFRNGGTGGVDSQ